MKLVIFDVDGTLIDSQQMIVSAMTSAFNAHRMALPSREDMLSVVGLSLETAMGVLCKEEPRQMAGPLADAYKAAFSQLRTDPDHHEPLFPGALDALDVLTARDDVILGIATGKSRRGVNAILDLHGLHGRFETIQTADGHPSKPNPAMVLDAMSETGILPIDTVVIGDTTYDIEMARAAGARAIGVSWGNHPPEALIAADADSVLAHFDELHRALACLFGDLETA